MKQSTSLTLRLREERDAVQIHLQPAEISAALRSAIIASGEGDVDSWISDIYAMHLTGTEQILPDVQGQPSREGLSHLEVVMRISLLNSDKETPVVYFRSRLVPMTGNAVSQIYDLGLETDGFTNIEAGGRYEGIDWDAGTTLFIVHAGTARMYQYPVSPGPISHRWMQMTVLKPLTAQVDRSVAERLQMGQWYLPMWREWVEFPPVPAEQFSDRLADLVVREAVHVFWKDKGDSDLVEHPEFPNIEVGDYYASRTIINGRNTSVMDELVQVLTEQFASGGTIGTVQAACFNLYWDYVHRTHNWSLSSISEPWGVGYLSGISTNADGQLSQS